MMGDAPSRSLRRGFRLARGFGFAALALYLSYLIAGNAFLNTGLADAAFNRKPERFHAQWQSALTLWPGRATFRGVAVRGQARRVQWQAQAQRVHVRVALWPLSQRQLRLDDVAADALQFDAQRVEADVPPPEARPGGWVIHLARIHSDSVSRVRWEDAEAVGLGQVDFGLWKQLRGGALEILPSRLQLREARVSWANEPWLQQAQLDLGFALARHVAADAPGNAKLALATLEIKLDAEGPHFSSALDSDDWMRLDAQPGGGRIEADLALREAQLQPGGRLSIALPVRHAQADGTRQSNVLTLEMAVDEGLALRASLPPQTGGIGSLAADLRLATRTWPAAGMPALLSLLDGDVALDWRFESLRWLSGALVRGEWLSFDGAGDLDAKLKIVAGKLAVGSRIEVPSVAMSTRVLQDRVQGTASAQGELVAGSDGAPQAQLRIEVQRFEIAAESAPEQVYVRGTDLRLALDADGDLARLRDTLRGQLNFRNAEIPDLTAYNHYLPRRNLAFTGGRGRLGAELELDAAGRVGKGRLQLSAKAAALRLSELALRADVGIDARLRRADFAGRKFDLGGTTLALDRVGYVQGDESRSDWWVRVGLPQSKVRWGRPLQFDGEADVQMKDVGFLLALFAQRRSFPKWALRLADAGHATLRGKAQLRGDALVLDELRAGNDRFAARARLSLHDQHRRGELLLSWKKLDLGVELRDAERKWHLRKAQAWFEQGKSYLSSPPR